MKEVNIKAIAQDERQTLQQVVDNLTKEKGEISDFVVIAIAGESLVQRSSCSPEEVANIIRALDALSREMARWLISNVISAVKEDPQAAELMGDLTELERMLGGARNRMEGPLQ